MPDNDSTEQRLSDFYHRSRVAMSGPVPRWDPVTGTTVKQGWGRELMIAGAAAVFILAVVGGARFLRQSQSPAAGPKPTPAPSAFTGSCKLPLTWADPSSGHMTGGFVSFPGASFATDPSVSGLNTPFGAGWVSYDAPMRRWVPVDRQMVSPDGATWVYSALRTGNENHAVDVRTGRDTTLWGSDRVFHVFGLENTFAYAMLDSTGVPQLWRLPLDGSPATQIRVGGNWQFVNGGAAWEIGSDSLAAGAPFSLQRLDLQHNTVTTWLQLPGPGTVVGFDGRGAPIVQVGGPGGDVIVVTSQGAQRLLAKSFYFVKGTIGIDHLPALGDAHGIWLAAQDGIYLSVNGGVPSKQSFPALLAGPCS